MKSEQIDFFGDNRDSNNGVGQERRIKAKAEKPENPVLLLDPTGAGFLHGWNQW